MVYELSERNYDDAITSYKGYSLVDFKAKWCTPCKLQKPVIELLSVKFDRRIVFYTCDIDEEPELVKRFQIFSVPTMLIIRGGQVLVRIVGYKTASVLEDILKKELRETIQPAGGKYF